MKSTMNEASSSPEYRLPRNIIYADESGNTGMRAVAHNKKHPFFIVGFCYCRNSRMISRQMHRLLLRLHNNRVYPARLNEIKFYPTPALRKLGYTEDEIKTTWSPNYALVREEILRVILTYSDGVFTGILDKPPLVAHGPRKV